MENFGSCKSLIEFHRSPAQSTFLFVVVLLAVSVLLEVLLESQYFARQLMVLKSSRHLIMNFNKATLYFQEKVNLYFSSIVDLSSTKSYETFHYVILVPEKRLFCSRIPDCSVLYECCAA